MLQCVRKRVNPDSKAGATNDKFKDKKILFNLMLCIEFSIESSKTESNIQSI